MSNSNNSLRHNRSRLRRITAVALTALLGAVLQLVGMTPAHAALLADSSDRDRTATMADGTTIKLRMLHPDSGKPANGWPLIVYRAGRGTNRCENISGYLANTGGSMTSLSATLTTTGSPTFTSADVGSVITVPGAGASGGMLTTTIASYTSGNSVTLAASNISGANLSGKKVTWATPWYTRQTLANEGYAVLSYNARGGPAGIHQGINPAGPIGTTSGCTKADDSADALNDNGWGGSDGSGVLLDKKDVKELIDYAVNTYTQSGCSSPCIDSSKIGMIGDGDDGLVTWLMPAYDSRIDAIVPMGTRHLVRNVANISNNGAGTFQPIDLGWNEGMLDTDQGQYGKSDSEVLDHWTTLKRSKYLNKTSWLVNATGDILTSSKNTVTLNAGSSPSFVAGDIGKPIHIEGALSAGDFAHSTTIDTVPAGNQVTLTTEAPITSNLTDARVSWPSKEGFTVPSATTSWFNERTVLDDNASVDKTEAFDSSTDAAVFVVHGALDGESSPVADIEAFKKINDNVNYTKEYLYVGACGALPAPCGPNNATKLREKLSQFFDKYVKGNSPTMGGPVFHLTPPKWDSTAAAVVPDNWNVYANPDDGVPRESATWLDSTMTGAYSTAGYTYCMTSDGAWSNCGPSSPSASAEASIAADTLERGQFECAADISFWGSVSGYESDQVKSYTLQNPIEGTDGPGANDFDLHTMKIAVDMYAKSSTPRLQLAVDVFEVNTSGYPNYAETSEVRIWQGVAMAVPVAREQVSAGTVVRFTFQPGGGGWTFKKSSKIRIKVASQYEQIVGTTHIGRRFAQEPYPGWYTILHSPSNPFKVTFWWVSPTTEN